MKINNRFKISALILCVCISFVFFSFHYKSSHPISSQPLISENFVLIIDAGHGGKDGGAIANDGTEEQHLNLQIANYLNDYLQMFGCTTKMTRKDENSIHDSDATTIRSQKISDIHNRMRMVNETNHAILISIHQNKFKENAYWGTQVFYSPNTTESAKLAEYIQNSVQFLLQPDNQRKIKKSGSSIYLLYKAKKPSVLVECGFLSNDAELQKLKNPLYQKEMAFSIAVGILNYLNEL